MKIEYDHTKDSANILKHGISLSRAVDMEILATLPDDRFDYSEPRYRAWGMIDGRYHCLVFAVRNSKIRIISLRRANDKEVKRYVRQTKK